MRGAIEGVDYASLDENTSTITQPGAAMASGFLPDWYAADRSSQVTSTRNGAEAGRFG